MKESILNDENSESTKNINMKSIDKKDDFSF